MDKTDYYLQKTTKELKKYLAENPNMGNVNVIVKFNNEKILECGYVVKGNKSEPI